MSCIKLATDWAEVVQTSIQILGFLFVIWQIGEIQKSLHSTAHSNIYTHYTETIRWFLDKPHLYPYFRQGMRLVGSVPDGELAIRRAEVLALCELTTTLFEHATLEKKNMPSTTWQNCWVPYIIASYQRSEEMVEFFKENRGVYVPEFQELIDSAILLKQQSESNSSRK